MLSEHSFHSIASLVVNADGRYRLAPALVPFYQFKISGFFDISSLDPSLTGESCPFLQWKHVKCVRLVKFIPNCHVNSSRRRHFDMMLMLRFIDFRCIGCAFLVRSFIAVARYRGLVPAQINEVDGRLRRTRRCSWTLVYIICLPVPPALPQLWTHPW